MHSVVVSAFNNEWAGVVEAMKSVVSAMVTKSDWYDGGW